MGKKILSKYYKINPLIFGRNPFLEIHKISSSLTSKECEKIINIADNLNNWGDFSKLGKSFDIKKDIDIIQIISQDSELIEPIEKLMNLIISFIKKTYIIKHKEDGEKYLINNKPIKIDYNNVIKIKPNPFLIKYDSKENPGLSLHKDNADISFIIMISDLKDFKGGGTYFRDINKTFFLKRSEILFFNGQLVHSGLPITKGKRYIISGFSVFSEEYLKIKRLGTLKTFQYFH